MTAIYYPDLSACSPEGTYRLEANSPYNLPDWHPDTKVRECLWPNAYQEDFVFTLYEAATERAVWSVEQGSVGMCSPHELYVSESKWVVIRTHGMFSARLVVLSPAGRHVLTINLLEEAFKGDMYRGYVHETSAGPYWSACSLGYFVHHEHSEYFCLRAWWNQRIVIDLQAATLIPACECEVDFHGAERTWALSSLESALPRLESWDAPRWPDDTAGLGDTATAITLVGRLRLAEAEPLLRAIEPVKLGGGYTISSLLKHGLQSGDPLWCMASTYLRPLAHLALLRIGARPRGFAHYRFFRDLGDDELDSQREDLEVPECLDDLEGRARQLSPGLTALEVLNLVGAPTHSQGRCAWDYDLPAGRCTLRVHFDRDDLVVTRLARLTPGWTTDKREQSINY